MLTSILGALLLAPAEFDLTILHTNDQHGHVLPFAYVESGRSSFESPSRGGAARRATLTKRLRAQATGPCILVDGGDVFTRGALTTAYRGAPDIEAMNATGYELGALGNNEFKAFDGADAGNAIGAQTALLAAIRRAKFPYVCANATDQHGNLLQGVKPFVVKKWNGVRVGFLGLVTERCSTYPQTKGWHFQDPIAAAKAWVPKVRGECDVLIAMTHIGTPLDLALAAKVPGIDAIVGADSHTFLYKPLEVRGPDGRSVPIVQDGEYAANVGRFQMWFRKTAEGQWRVSRYSGSLIPVDSRYPEDPAVNAVLAPYVKPFLKPLGEVQMGQSRAERMTETLQVFAKAIRDASGAQIGLVAEDAFQTCFSGPTITRYDIYASEPFHNNIVVGTMTGRQIRDALGQPGAFGTSSQLDEDATYRCAVIDFLASKYPLRDPQPMQVDIREAVVKWLHSTSK